MITIIDYKTGNLGSIQNILKRIGEESLITSDKEVIAESNKLILPGVGSFDTGMRNLIELDLINILNHKVLIEKTPVLGICLGMQLFSRQSEEGIIPGLGWINGETRRFKFSDTVEYKIPHMGWNYVKYYKDSSLFKGLVSDARFYFVHSFYLNVNEQSDILATSTYETEFTAAIEKGNIMGVQFHPEKSHKFGMMILRNFVDNY